MDIGQNSHFAWNWPEQLKHLEIDWNLTRGGMDSITVLDYIPVWKVLKRN